MSTFAIALVLISTVTHAGWNLILGSQRTVYTFLRITAVIAVIGLGPTLAAEIWGKPLPRIIWLYLLVTAVFQALYYLGLSKGYQNGNFSVVYPIARALPILVVALADVGRGNAPSQIGWLGMLLVSAGCIFIPLRSIRNFDITHYWNPAMLWTLLAALGTIGYTIVDNAAADLNHPGPLMAARYGILEFTFATVIYWLILKGSGQPTGDDRGWQGWRWPVIGAFAVFGTYWLILWSYQLSPQASYIVALRQFSIIIGVAVGVFLFREPAPAIRISAAVIIAVGVAGIALAG